jgi:GntR family transcriptional regulator of vanillate catabolism
LSQDRATERLRQFLLRGEFRPDERLSELSLVDRLGVSRTPIRRAFEKLAQEGLLVAKPNGGFVVRGFTIADIWDAIESRGALESVAARLAAERLESPSQLEPLREYTAGMSALPQEAIASSLRYSELNGYFHSGMVELAKSSVLRWALDRFQSIPFAAPARVVSPVASEISRLAVEQHYAIIDAIERRDPNAAEKAAREHGRLARRNLELALGDKNILGRVPGASLIRVGLSAFDEDQDRFNSPMWS